MAIDIGDLSRFEQVLRNENFRRSSPQLTSFPNSQNFGIMNTDQAAIFSDDAGLDEEYYEDFAEVAKPGFNLGFAKQLGSGLLGLITGNPLANLIGRGIGALGDRFGRPGIRGGIGLRGDSTFDTFGRSTSFADFAQRMRDKRAREDAARRGSLKDLQGRIDKGDFNTGKFDKGITDRGRGNYGGNQGGFSASAPGGSNEMGSF
tara:strand:+ start:892 stop:1503 length:612 start_codon:yes stop_codon:yes gene_type:complete